MKTFHCSECGSLIFFENDRCLTCGNTLAYLPDQGIMAALEKDAEDRWHALPARQGSPTYRLCANFSEQAVCNWAIPASDPEPLCLSCRLTRVIPDMSVAANKTAWYRLEAAKRRLVYTLLNLALPVLPKSASADGLAFEFLDDQIDPNGDRTRVLTGHDNGVIVVNIAEADDVLREQQRLLQNEPYRTLIGHCRHEVGHYYWDRLIANGTRLDEFRELFGDERDDYPAALARHYESGPPAAWEQRFISAYASSHPWEDWAESWAHYLHMIDALETAASAGVTLRPARNDEPSMPAANDASGITAADGNADFNSMMTSWVALTYALNNLTRSLGQPDAYPFVLSPAVVGKLAFIHSTIRSHRLAPAANAPIAEDAAA